MFKTADSFLQRLGTSRIEAYEAAAEKAYSAMYDAKRYEVRDHYDDAQSALRRALELAKEAGRDDAVARIEERRKHIQDVYFSQFL